MIINNFLYNLELLSCHNAYDIGRKLQNRKETKKTRIII